MTEIVYVDYGIANRYDNIIELNKNLLAYPDLHDTILKHELSHTDKQGFTKEDLFLDLADDRVDKFKLLKFMFKYPKSFIQLLPFYKRNKIFFYDINMIIFWIILLFIIVISVYLII